MPHVVGDNMSYIVFENPGAFDLRLIKTFGVNVKPNSENPIGYFGTGLKYATAIILRNGGEFYIQDGELREYTVDTKKTAIRGKEFPLIQLCHDYKAEELAYTTELGKNWLPWHAYRELYSNAKDEGGKHYKSEVMPEPKRNIVRFIVKCDAITKVFNNHDDYFLDPSRKMLGSNEELEVFAGEGRKFYYNYILVYEEQLAHRYTYNAKRNITLTEDRTSHLNYERQWMQRRFWTECQNKNLLREFAVTPHQFYTEGKLNFENETLSTEFYEVLDDLLETQFDKIMPSLRKNALARRAENERLQPITLTPVQQKMLDRGVRFLKKNGYPVDDYPILAVNLGESLMGMAEDQKIYVSRVAFDKGMKQVVATLLEEYIHIHHAVGDCTRQMQDVLFDKIVNMMEEKLGEPI
jgi:hypothetical protein